MKEKIIRLMEVLLSDSHFPAMYKPVINSLITGALAKTDDATIRQYVIKLRDELIPWILE